MNMVGITVGIVAAGLLMNVSVSEQTTTQIEGEARPVITDQLKSMQKYESPVFSASTSNDKYTPVQFSGDIDLFSEKITEETALGLVAESQRRFWYLTSSGKGSNEYLTFTPEGMDVAYRFLSEDIGTKAKLSAYFEEIHTVDATNSFISDQFSKKLLLEHEGRLIQPDADGGSLLEWGNAKLEKMTQNDNKATATFKVPLGDQGIETYTIQFTYQKDEGWRIADSPQQLR